jgi:hypothetical protein
MYVNVCFTCVIVYVYVCFTCVIERAVEPVALDPVVPLFPVLFPACPLAPLLGTCLSCSFSLLQRMSLLDLLCGPETRLSYICSLRATRAA